MLKLKNSAMLVVAALCGYLALMTPNWKGDLVAATGCAYVSDTDCNGVDDILLRNVGDGRNEVHQLAGDGSGTVEEVVPLTTNALTWDLQAVFDANGDNTLDYLWNDDVNKNLIFWLMDGEPGPGPGTKLGNSFLGTTQATLSNLGDFDGDGDTDIVLITALGDVKIWTIQNAAKVQAQNIGTPAGTFEIKATGDFNGDGIDDLIMQDANGNNRIWQLDNTGALDTTIDLPQQAVSFELKKAGDGDGDGDDDIIFRDDTTGQTIVWVMENGLRAARNFPTGLNVDMTLATVVDFDGDGDDDMMFRDITPGNSTDGDTIIWLMENNNKQSNSFLGNNAVTFLLKSTLDMDGDGDLDILYQDPTTGQLLGWNMANGVKLGNYNLGFFGTNWETRFGVQ